MSNFKLNEEYWLNMLIHHKEPVSFPIFGHKNMEKSEGKHHEFTAAISMDCFTKLKEKCKGDEVNIVSFLFSALTLNLHTYSGAKEFIVLASFLNMESPNLNGLKLFLPVKISKDQSFKSFFVDTRQGVIEGAKHKDYDFEKVTGKMATRGVAGAYEDMISLTYDKGAIKEGEEFPFNTNIAFRISENSSQALCINLYVKKGKYSVPYIDQLMKSFAALLSQIVEAPSKLIGQYKYLEQQQERITAHRKNEALLSQSLPGTLISAFKAQVKENPLQKALVIDGVPLTYQDLDYQSNLFAQALREQYQLGPGDTVGLLLEEPEYLLQSILAVLKTGASYLPSKNSDLLDASVLKSLNVSLLITNTQTMFHLGEYELDLIAVDMLLPTLSVELDIDNIIQDVNSPAIILCDQSAVDECLILSHGNLTSTLLRQAKAMEIKGGDRLLSFSFDQPIGQHHYELWLVLLSGATLVNVAGEIKSDPEKLMTHLTGDHVDILVSSFGTFYKEFSVEELDLSQKIILFSHGDSDYLPKLATNENLDIWYCYGKAEASFAAAVYQMDIGGGDALTGNALFADGIFILNEDNEMVPDGRYGKISLGGQALGKMSPIGNSENIENYYLDSQFGPLLLTTDTGRRRPDGYIELLVQIEVALKGNEKRLSVNTSTDSVDLHIPAKSDIEKLLINISEHVLHQENIGLNEDFFTIGGDSIKAIQVITKLSQSGYALDMKDIFKHKTFGKVASSIQLASFKADQSLVEGQLPLTPIQKKFFSFAGPNPHYFNQAFAFRFSENLTKEAVEAVIRALQSHHDALRMSFDLSGEHILQENKGNNYPISLDIFDFRAVREPLRALEDASSEIHATIDLKNGPIMKNALIWLPDETRFLISMHHLVVDMVSWNILFEDIAQLFMAQQQGKPLKLSQKTSSYKDWALKLTDFADSPMLLKEKDYWKTIASVDGNQVRKDFEEGSQWSKDILRKSIQIDPDEVHRLTSSAGSFNASINEVLISSLAKSFYTCFGMDQLTLALEKHGREPLFEDIDVNRTVGWFTSVYPFSVGHIDGDMKDLLKDVKKRFRGVPNGGVGYGTLRYLTSPHHTDDMNFGTEPQVSFNYLGEMGGPASNQNQEEVQSVSITTDQIGVTMSPQQKVPYALDISAVVVNKNLTITICYSKQQYKSETIEQLLEGFKEALAYFMAPAPATIGESI